MTTEVEVKKKLNTSHEEASALKAAKEVVTRLVTSGDFFLVSTIEYMSTLFIL